MLYHKGLLRSKPEQSASPDFKSGDVLSFLKCRPFAPGVRFLPPPFLSHCNIMVCGRMGGSFPLPPSGIALLEAITPSAVTIYGARTSIIFSLLSPSVPSPAAGGLLPGERGFSAKSRGRRLPEDSNPCLAIPPRAVIWL